MRGWMVAVLLALLACAACSGGESERGTAPPAAPQREKPTSIAERKQIFRDSWKWAGSGSARDLDADLESCQAAADDSRAGLAKVAEGIRCMKDKGWDYQPPSS